MYVARNIWTMMFNKKILLLDSVGFNSLSDYLNNVFVNKWLLVTAGVLGGIFSTIDHFINANVFCPSRGIWVLAGATLLDVLLGVIVSFKEKKFDVYKLNRAWIRLATQIVFVFLINQITIVWELINDWLVSTLLLAFVVATTWSAFKNAYKLKWIQPFTYKIIERILTVEKVFNEAIKKLFTPPKDKDK